MAADKCPDCEAVEAPPAQQIDTDRAFMEDLLAYHPEAAEKRGSGIEAIYVDVDPTPYRATTCFYIRRTDGSTIDFSFMTCLKHASLVLVPS